MTKTVLTRETHLIEDTCGLEREGYRIAEQFHEVLEAFRERWENEDVDVEVAAGGCNTCTVASIESDVYAYYTAQNRGVDKLYVGFGASDDVDVTKEEVGESIRTLAQFKDVPVDWDGDTAHCVCLGDSEAYGEKHD